MPRGNTYFNLFNIPIIFVHLLQMFSECLFPFRFVSIVSPKKLNSSTFSIITLSILSVRYCISLFGTWKIIYLDLFSDNLFICNHSITLESSAFIKYSLVCILFPKDFKLLNSVVSSAYIINLNILLAWEKSLIYMINNKGPSIEPCGTPIVIGRISDLVSSNSTYCFRLLR